MRVLLADSNNSADQATVQVVTSSGDLETVGLQREGSVFLGTLFSTAGSVPKAEDRLLQVLPQDNITALYVDGDTGSGRKQIELSAPTVQDYLPLAGLAAIPTGSGAESRLFAPAGRGGVGSALVALPFAFPFYGQKHRTARVYGDGDTAVLRNGLNSFGIALVDNAFAQVRIPTTGGSGMNVFVNNP